MSSLPLALPTSLDNPEQWDEITREITSITSVSGPAPAITAETITDLVANALPLLFQANTDVNPLRGTFNNQAIAQRVRNASSFQGIRPSSVAVHLVGATPGDDGQPVLRVHLTISAQGPDGQSRITHQFWDLAISAQASPTKPQSGCSNCGAPLALGELFCSHCGADLRPVAAMTLTVVKLQLY